MNGSVMGGLKFKIFNRDIRIWRVKGTLIFGFEVFKRGRYTGRVRWFPWRPRPRY